MQLLTAGLCAMQRGRDGGESWTDTAGKGLDAIIQTFFFFFWLSLQDGYRDLYFARHIMSS